MVGPPPSAAATATPVVVVTNSRRSMRFCFVMDLPSVGQRAVLGARYRVSVVSDLTSGTRHLTLSQCVQYAEGNLVGVRGSGVVARHRPEVFQPDGVAASAEPQQRVIVVAQLAGEDECWVVLHEPLHVGLVHPGVCPQTPVRREIVASLGPGTPAPDVALLRDVGELLAERLAVVEVAV